jgi:acyl-CoA thioester hydrolase
VVTALAVRYLKPARLDDRLDVSARLARVGAASLHFEQQLVRDGELLAAGQVKVACVSAETLAPAAMPASLRRALARPVAVPESR